MAELIIERVGQTLVAGMTFLVLLGTFNVLVALEKYIKAKTMGEAQRYRNPFQPTARLKERD